MTTSKPSPPARPSLAGLVPDELAAVLNLKPYQGRQVFRWIHQKRVFNFEDMTDLPKARRTELGGSWQPAQLTPLAVAESPKSGTKKLLLRLEDKQTVEAVLLRHRRRVTLCLSTQVGCPVGCTFCATGQSGFRRDLTAGEIVEQALQLLVNEDLGDRTPNIVYMGMGEPFLNYEALVGSLRLVMAPEGLGVGARKITVSTVGDVPGIRRFAEEDWQVRLSVSLHAVNDRLRSQLVPINRKHPLDRLRRALQHYGQVTGRRVTLEWTLLAGANDSAQDAAELATWMDGLDAGVNLIPYNPVAGVQFSAPSRQQCLAFREALVRRGISATLRQSLGGDVDAACGQLRSRQG